MISLFIQPEEDEGNKSDPISFFSPPSLPIYARLSRGIVGSQTNVCMGGRRGEEREIGRGGNKKFCSSQGPVSHTPPAYIKTTKEKKKKKTFARFRYRRQWTKKEGFRLGTLTKKRKKKKMAPRKRIFFASFPFSPFLFFSGKQMSAPVFFAAAYLAGSEGGGRKTPGGKRS